MKKIRCKEAISSRGNSLVNDLLNSSSVRGIKKSLAEISYDNLLSECPLLADCAAPAWYPRTVSYLSYTGECCKRSN